MTIDRRRSTFTQRAVERAEQRSAVRSRDPNEWANIERKAVLRQARETHARALKSEETFDTGLPRAK